ncbi:XRE family transcriptional regulator [Arthrobacter sp. RIT-PI-e]|uniref:helix-turn-helix transcriptional regulator n=1 Tax=Arthrobacter sp. RIT-PI-e TaxID=1681197 RepID=UPI00067646BE|nr:helix-turn-helix transcriptional regulator [Arthrobacter sp. RIT-PI-e]KNC19753.1 XRE family transcriptional regulator [Arthrobacter sp. RIT-PI-e]
MDRAAEISAFLRSRRARLSPTDLKAPFDGRVRRVPGLRREEVARLAGISSDYYMRIEQGRSGAVSLEIIDSLALALRLDNVERNHLLNLCGTPTPHHAPELDPQRVRQGLYDLLAVMDSVPAIILGRRTDVLASNRLARALMTDFEALPATHRNYARFILLDPRARELYEDWEQVSAQTTAMLHLDVGRFPDDRQLAELISDLREGCPEFTSFWADQNVHEKDQGEIRFNHAVMGPTVLHYQTLQVPGEADQSVCTYYGAPGSSGEAALAALAAATSSTATRA